MKNSKTLRTGYTTGSCAAAATKAAILSFISQSETNQVEINLPVGKTVTFVVEKCQFSEKSAACSVIKDGGDDPDVTTGAEIIAKITPNKFEKPNIFGGEGVGKVTRPGLGLEVGQCAINPVPRKMIIESIESAIKESGKNVPYNFDIEISVPDGKKIAKKTLNERLGIIGGISILGTRGTVTPYSTEAYKHCITTGINVALKVGVKHLVFTTGGRSEKWAMNIINLPEVAFIQMADFVGFSLNEAIKKNVERITIAAMPGKMAKIASGFLQTHARKSVLNMELMASFAEEAGINNPILLKEIREANTSRHVFETMEKKELILFSKIICKKASEVCSKEIEQRAKIETLLLDFEGKELARHEI
ncbi:MAG: cobalt-precorrin-5B (C(1))-methyltransferase [Nitrospinae bacterium]|nr:cobalt-precorrin-5B (C(1))-methyltransferase [Nitrospinota bacterium]